MTSIPKVEDVCFKCGAKIVKLGNQYKILTSFAEQNWDRKGVSGLMTTSDFSAKCCFHVKGNGSGGNFCKGILYHNTNHGATSP